MRFHVGFSFRPKQIIKWLIPILIALGLLSVSDFVKADTRIDVSVPDVDELDVCGRPLTDYINYFTFYSGQQYNFLVSYSNDYTEFIFVPNTYYDLNFYSSVSGNNTYLTYFYNTSVDESKIDLMYLSTFVLSYSNDESKCNNTDFLDSPSASQDFLDYIESYHTSFNFNTINSTNLTGYSQVYSQNVCSRIQISNNRDYIFNECNSDNNIIFSSNEIIYQDSSPPINGYGEHYPTYINGSILTNGQIIEPSYYPPVDFPVYGQPIRDIYFVAFASTMSNLKLTYTFVPEDSSYGQHVYPFIVRSYALTSPYTSVYSHTNTSCSINNYSYTNNSNGSITLNINGFSCSGSTGIGQVSFKISMVSDDDKIYSVNDFTYTFSGANTNGQFYDTYNKVQAGYILFNYYNLSRQFKFFISSSNNSSTQVVSVNSSNNWTYMVPYNISPFEETNPLYNEYYKYSGGMMYGQYGLSINRGLLITNNYTMSQDLSSVNLFFYEGTYIYVDSQGSSSQVCYWNGTQIQCSNVSISFIETRPDNDLSYYFDEVSKYMNSISSDMVRFGQVVQRVYDEIPSSIRTLTFVLFILGNIAILLRIVKR